MNSAARVSILMVCAGGLAIGQSPEAAPKFEAADVHGSEKTSSLVMRTVAPRAGRYEVRNATMVDLIRIAHGFDPDKILGGPNWLELDRFDVIAKVPGEATAESVKPLLRTLLEERFQLKVHKDNHELPTYALIAGKKPQIKEASGSEESGCKPKSASGGPSEGSVQLMMGNADGSTTAIRFGPGMTLQYACRNITMEAFAASLRGMIGASLGPNAVVDQTGLKGRWNFDLTYSLQLLGPAMGDAGDRISIYAAIEKQLGLKLEEKQISTPVLMVDAVNRQPSPNPPDTAAVLPKIPAPTEFEVGTIKPSDPSTRMNRFQMQPGGRLNIQNMPLRFLINRAFDTNTNDQIAGLPGSMEMDRYDVAAKMPPSDIPWGPMDMDAASKPLLALLVDRFKMTYHKEDRPVTTYSLVAAKPKMKKADPASRIFCRNTNAPPNAPPGSRMMKCQNITIPQFAERLQNQSPDLQWPVLDATGIEGGWDFTLIFSFRPMMLAGAGRGGDTAGTNAVPSASDPTGGYSLSEALEKELGLKLEKQKRPMPVFVIDHIEPKPSDN